MIFLGAEMRFLVECVSNDGKGNFFGIRKGRMLVPFGSLMLLELNEGLSDANEEYLT